jgi:uncharacterized RDD family membrane protein YckC
MRWTDEVRIETPEQVEVDLELAGLGSRFVAQFIDWLWKLLFTLVLGLLILVIASVLGRGREFSDPSNVMLAGAVAVTYALWLGYGVYFEVKWNGQTPGKRFAKIRALQVGGAPLDVRAAGVRNLLAFADFLPGFFLFGALLILLTNRKQRLGDMAAGTVVIRERVIDPGADPLAAVVEEASEEIGFAPSQVTALTTKDVTVIREFLTRYDEMRGPSRIRLAARLAEKYAEQIGATPPDDPRDARTFLASLVRDYLQSRRHD